MVNNKKYKQLGMPLGTASARLKKQIMLHLLGQLDQDICFRCGCKIKSAVELSIDHKVNWLNKDTELFWDLKNIAFSHNKCNTREKEYNWDAIQMDYDAGLSWRDLTRKYGISKNSLSLASKRNDFKSRNWKEIVSIRKKYNTE
jgi:hypothetical protein